MWSRVCDGGGHAPEWPRGEHAEGGGGHGQDAQGEEGGVWGLDENAGRVHSEAPKPQNPYSSQIIIYY